MKKSCTDHLHRSSLNEHLFSVAKAPDRLRHLILEIAKAAKYIQFAIRTTEAGLSGNVNAYGEEQLKLDVLSDQIIEQHLCESRLVSAYVSEEHNEIVELSTTAPYVVVFDPLDGSSLVDANVSIGSIFGIYEGNDVLGKKPQNQIAALYVLYGPRTTLVYSTGSGVHQFVLNDVGEFVLLREYLGIADTAKNYSPGNLHAVHDAPSYGKLLGTWMEEKFTLRYSGCMVADIHHILSKGQGIFTNIGGGAYPDGKLRLVFECGPFAYIVKQAGGAASDGKQPILGKTIQKIDQRTPILIGSKKEVERARNILNA